MQLTLILTAVAIIGIVLLITLAKIPPVFALLAGTLFLGLTTIGPAETPPTVAAGFGDVMADIGLLIAFGVIMGVMLTQTGALPRLIDGLVGVFGPKRITYVFSVSLSSLFTSIYSDVVLVLTAPMARRIAPRLGPRGIALMGGALTAGIEVGLVFVVPGVAALAAAGLLGVPLGQMFIWGLVIGLPTAILTTIVFNLLARRALRWGPGDEMTEDAEDVEAPAAGTGPVAPPASAPSVAHAGATGTNVQIIDRRATGRQLHLGLALAPILATLTLIALGALLTAFGVEHPVLGFVTDPIFAMFVGAASSYGLARMVSPREKVDKGISESLVTCGPILVLSGVSGSLGMVIEAAGLADILAGFFSDSAIPALLLVWLIAAVIHIALGSISISVITAAGILAPVAESLGVPLVLIALAAGSGALFLPHVSSNFFWMFKELLGLTTRGTFKTHTVAMSLASVISLALILVLDLFI